MAERAMVGVGIDAYERLPELRWPVDEVQQVARRFREGGFAVFTALDARRGAIVDALDASGSPSGLVVLWAGHGERDARGGLRLFAVENAFDDGDLKLVTVDQLAQAVAGSGARQILLIIDTCYSGGAAMDAAGVVAALRGRIETGDRRWIGVLTSSRAHEPALDGLLGPKLLDLLDYGPAKPELRLVWSVYQEFLRGPDLVDALLEEWGDDVGQKPEWVTQGHALAFLPNPLYRPGASEAVVEHLLWSARGGSQAEAGFWFTGREAQLREIVTWAARLEPGLCFVTGEAGCGKSAVAGRIVSLSNAVERAQIEAATGLPAEDPGVGSVDAHVQVRGLSLEQVAESLSRQLGTPGKHYQEVLGALATRPAPLIVIDGLDEAADDVIAKDFLAPLARYARVLIATRTVPEPLAGLTIELDNSPVHDYVLARLKDVAVDAQAVAAAIDGPFLLARLITSQLIAEPGSIDDLPSTIEEAFRGDLGGDARALDLLSALAYSYGQGFPVDVWTAVAGREDAIAVLAEYGRYVTASSLDGQAVYRLHQRIADVLRGDAVVWPAVLDAYERHLERGLRADQHPYLWNAAWRHAADGGPDGAERLAELAERDPSLRPDVGYAWRGIGVRLAQRGQLLQAVAPTERAVAVLEAVESDDDGLAGALENLGRAYAQVGRWDEALVATQRAVTIRERMAAANAAYLARLADALDALGLRYKDLGRFDEVVAPTERSVEIYEALAARDPAVLPDLARVLNNLGDAYGTLGRDRDAFVASERALKINPESPALRASVLAGMGARHRALGRRAEALAATERAVALYEQLAAESPGHRGDLATVLITAGVLLSDAGRTSEALPATRRAVAINEALAAENPGQLGAFASSLNALANNLQEVGRLLDAVAPAEQAVAIYEQLSPGNPAFAPRLAMALGNLGRRYRDVGRSTEAIAVAERSVALYTELAGFRDELATALSNLAALYRPSDAIAPEEQALAIRERLAAENPSKRPELAASLNNLSFYYGEVGWDDDSLAYAERAVAILAELTADDPTLAPRFALALTTLGLSHQRRGDPAAAIDPTERALAIREQLEDPTIAASLMNLGVIYELAGRRSDALTATARAVDLYDRIAAEDPLALRELGGALNNLGRLTRDEGEAIALLTRAAAIREDLAAERPELLDDLVGTLNNLGSRERWEAALRRFGSDRYASTLLRARASFATADDLMQALRLDPGGDALLTADIHDALRARRDEVEWDGEMPLWLTFDDALMEACVDWVRHRAAPEHLDPRLLCDEGEAVLAELALRHPLGAAQRLLAACRREGIEIAYRPYRIHRAYAEWRESGGDPPELLLAPDAIAEIEDPVDAARLTLAANEAAEMSLEDARRRGSPAVLLAVAVLGYEDDPARATVHMAMAQALSGQPADALGELGADEDVRPLIADVSDAIAHRPEQARELAALLTALSRPSGPGRAPE